MNTQVTNISWSPHLKQFSTVLTRGVAILAFILTSVSVQAQDVAKDTPLAVVQSSPAQTRNSDGPLQNWLRRRAQTTDDWMTRHVDRSDWMVGWWHDYVNTDGSPRTWRPDNRPSDLDSSDAGRKLREGWTYMFRARHIETVRDAAWLYRTSGEQRYAKWAIGQLTFYATHYAQWPLQRRLGLSRLMGQSLDEASAIIHLAEAARAVRHQVSTEQWEHWRRHLFLPVADTLRRSVNGLNNISVWQRSALGVIALLLDDSTIWRDAVEGPTGFNTLIEQGLTRDGIWYEGSFGYNAYVIRAALPLLRAAKEAGRSAELAGAAKRLQMALTAPLALRFDDGTLPNPSDSTSRQRVPEIPLFAETRTLLPTPWGDSAAMLHPGWSDVWTPVPALAATVPALPKVQSVALTDTSMGLLKDSAHDWQVFTHWGQRTQHHAQREALNIEIHWRGKPVSIDPGTISYGSPMHNSYYTQPAAHNVPFVDDKGQQGWNPGEMLAFDAVEASLTVSQPRYTPDVRVDRSTSLSGGSFQDHLQFHTYATAPSPKTMGLTWHFDCPLSGSEQLLPNSDAVLPKSEGFQYWSQVRAYRASGKTTITAQCTQGVLHLTLDAVGDYDIFMARAPNLPAGTYRDVIYLRAPFGAAGIRSTLSPLLQ